MSLPPSHLQAKGVEFVLPVDVVVADKFAPDANAKVVDINSIPDGWMVREGWRGGWIVAVAMDGWVVIGGL